MTRAEIGNLAPSRGVSRRQTFQSIGVAESIRSGSSPRELRATARSEQASRSSGSRNEPAEAKAPSAHNTAPTSQGSGDEDSDGPRANPTTQAGQSKSIGG